MIFGNQLKVKGSVVHRMIPVDITKILSQLPLGNTHIGFHLNDLILFKQSIHASIEAGHGNECEQHYESVAI